MSEYEVIVGNIGVVHRGNNPFSAAKVFGEYRRQSQEGVGRAGGESVCMTKDGVPMHEYVGPRDKEDK